MPWKIALITLESLALIALEVLKLFFMPGSLNPEIITCGRNVHGHFFVVANVELITLFLIDSGLYIYTGFISILNML